jgi:hypothetical protein
MSKSSRPRKKPALEEPTIQQTKTVKSLLILSNSLSALVTNLGSLSALIVSLFVLCAAVYEALRGPDISSDLNSDPSQPFAYPFIVRNNSLWFSMVNAKMYCEVEKIVTHNNRSTEVFRVGETSGLIHSDDSQIGRSSPSSHYESRNCRQRHASRKEKLESIH